jgi:hypothetical protein
MGLNHHALSKSPRTEEKENRKPLHAARPFHFCQTSMRRVLLTAESQGREHHFLHIFPELSIHEALATREDFPDLSARIARIECLEIAIKTHYAMLMGCALWNHLVAFTALSRNLGGFDGNADPFSIIVATSADADITVSFHKIVAS